MLLRNIVMTRTFMAAQVNIDQKIIHTKFLRGSAGAVERIMCLNALIKSRLSFFTIRRDVIKFIEMSIILG